ncbi:hypothetical protein T484DRAFT_1814168 [Baffinella frigidus]|nr:hypothetical protein T484DRAFT_1814168 [Cryptophyta sp. CCMP2293]
MGVPSRLLSLGGTALLYAAVSLTGIVYLAVAGFLAGKRVVGSSQGLSFLSSTRTREALLLAVALANVPSAQGLHSASLHAPVAFALPPSLRLASRRAMPCSMKEADHSGAANLLPPTVPRRQYKVRLNV